MAKRHLTFHCAHTCVAAKTPPAKNIHDTMTIRTSDPAYEISGMTPDSFTYLFILLLNLQRESWRVKALNITKDFMFLRTTHARKGLQYLHS